MNIHRIGREVRRRVRRVTRSILLGVTAGLASDDSDEEMGMNYANIAQSTSSERRPRSESWSRAPSPEPLTKRKSLPDLRVISATPQVDVEKIRQSFGEVRVRPAGAPEPRRAREPEPRRAEERRSVEPPNDVRTTKFARDRNGNWVDNKMDLAVAGWDIKPRYRLVERRPRVSITQCCDNISDVVTQRKSSG